MANQHPAGKFIGKLLNYPENSKIACQSQSENGWPNRGNQTMKSRLSVAQHPDWNHVFYCFVNPFLLSEILFPVRLLYEHCYKFECWVSLYMKDSSFCDYHRHCHSWIHCKRNNSHKKVKQMCWVCSICKSIAGKKEHIVRRCYIIIII